MQNWTKLLAQALLVVVLIVSAAVASRAVYVRVTPKAVDEVHEERDIHHEIADCGVQRKPTEHGGGRKSEDNAIWMASCLDS